MREKWIQHMKKADFEDWGRSLSVSPLVARILRNRDILTKEDARKFLYGTVSDLADPYLLSGMREAVALIRDAVRRNVPVAISSDYDDDGIFSARILFEGIREVGGKAYIFSPNRITEGYGINHRIIEEALAKGCGLLVTCDNGISAKNEIDYAREKGLAVVVTDHHEIPYDEGENGEKKYILPAADAIVDPKLPESPYPFKELCGAGVAFRLIQCLYEVFGIEKEREKELYEYVAIATVADVVPLQDENRILVKAGLEALHHTKKVPLLALMEACGIEKRNLSAYHIGFVIGPAFNAIGRLGDISLAFRFLDTEDPGEAWILAEEIRSVNEERKQMTEDGFRNALETIERDRLSEDKVILVYLPDVHESVVGIIAGRVKEKYQRPAFVLTKAEDGNLKGSGRSIREYHMVAELTAVKELLLKYGGHKMAAGLSLLPENLEALRTELNRRTTLTEADLTPKVYIDAELPLSYVTPGLVEELALLEPAGMANTKPLFAGKHFKVLSARIVGKNRNVLSLLIADNGRKMSAVMFGDPDSFLDTVRAEYGDEAVQKMLRGNGNADMAFVFYPEFNDFRGERNVQIIVTNYCRIR